MVASALLLSGCGTLPFLASPKVGNPVPAKADLTSARHGGQTRAHSGAATMKPKADRTNPGSSVSGTVTTDVYGNHGGVQTITDPTSILVLVNKQNRLPNEYVPPDLVVPDVTFLYGARDAAFYRMRKVAAVALTRMFEAARQDGVYFDGVSAYRSYGTQKALFDQYMQQDGKAAAEQFSALPGESEHETGLAIDVSGSSGKCAVASCFADTKQAQWLQAHADQFGFIMRYPKGMETITGYEYEPWHIRYVGVAPAEYIMQHGLTLDQYLQAGVASSP